MIEPNGTLSRPGSRSFCRSTAMKSHIVLSVALAIVAALGTGGAGAQSLRCNSDLASVGDSGFTYVWTRCCPGLRVHPSPKKCS